MFQNDRTRLSPSASDALDALREPIDRADGLSRAAVAERLVATGFERRTATVIVSELLSKGYLYEVDGLLYVTPV